MLVFTLAATLSAVSALDLSSLGTQLAAINLGMMQSMQQSTTNTLSVCYQKTNVTGQSIIATINTQN